MRELPELSLKSALALWLAALVATVPFAVLLPRLMAEASASMALGGYALFYLVAAAIGWSLGSRLGLGAPLVEAWLDGRRGDVRELARSALLGAILGVAAVVFVLALAWPWPDNTGPDVLPWWSGLAQALYGGIGEELLFRFGMMALIAWMITHLGRFFDTLLRWSRPSWELAPNVTVALWGGLVISSVVFGLAHAGQGEGTTIVQVSLRLAAGFLFGWLYWRRGIESAMAAHLAYDLVAFYANLALVRGVG
ncbi:MAG: CPBP family intramembrane glutamic endopeptidase [Alphaproteobacteria bacterium]